MAAYPAQAEARVKAQEAAEEKRRARKKVLRDLILCCASYILLYAEARREIASAPVAPIEHGKEQARGASNTVCIFFEKTGLCRRGAQCPRLHPVPETPPVTLRLPNMFVSSHLPTMEQVKEKKQASPEERLALQKDFDTFFMDVLPEFAAFGVVVTIKVRGLPNLFHSYAMLIGVFECAAASARHGLCAV